MNYNQQEGNEMLTENEKPKMYFVCSYVREQWWSCYGVLSNGFCFGQHVCSHPIYAENDLYFQRQERIDALHNLFGFEWSKEEVETITVQSKKDIPEWWESQKELQDGLQPQYEKYKEMIGESKSKVEVVTSP